MINKNWNDVNYISVFIISILAFLGAALDTKRYCKTYPNICEKNTKTQKVIEIIIHTLFDFISISAISLIVYIGMIGYGFNELLSVAVAGFLATEGNKALYQLKLLVADRLNSQALKEELEQEKEGK